MDLEKILLREDVPVDIKQIIEKEINEQKHTLSLLIEKERLSAVGELASGVAHDFNNFLELIMGTVEITLLEKNLSSHLREHLFVIKTFVNDSAQRVQKLQSFAGKSEGNSRFVSIDVNELLDDVIVQSQYKWKSMSCNNKVLINKNYGKINSIDGNVAELRSAFYNLIKNGYEAMPRGGVLSFETGNLEDNSVFVDISDTGVGMSEEVQKKLFQPFFTTKGFELGRGIGMSAVYSAIRDHDGEVYVKKSVLNNGTTIEIILPYGLKIKKESLENRVSKSYNEKLNVLWVEDDIMIGQIGRVLLESKGHRVNTLNSAEQALKELHFSNEYDLIITDLNMEGIGGLKFLEEINHRYPSSNIAVVSGSKYVITPQIQEKYNIGYVLGKPFDSEHLDDLINTMFSSNNY